MSERAEWRASHAAASREVTRRLEHVRAALDRWCEAAPERLDRRPGPARWTPREILEHVALANRYLLLLARKIRTKSRRRIERGEPWPTAAPRNAALAALARDRSRWDHPEHMTPTGDRPLLEVRRELAAQLAECLALVEEMPNGEGTLHRIRMSRVQGEDRLGLVELLDVIARHAERHLRQLDEAVQALGR